MAVRSYSRISELAVCGEATLDRCEEFCLRTAEVRRVRALMLGKCMRNSSAEACEIFFNIFEEMLTSTVSGATNFATALRNC